MKYLASRGIKSTNISRVLEWYLSETKIFDAFEMFRRIF